MGSAGDRAKPLLIAGHSHIFALGARPNRGVPKPQAHRELPNVWFLVAEAADRQSAKYWDALVSLADEYDLALLYRGNQHHASFLLKPDPLFDFWDDEVAEVESREARIVPRAMVKAFFRTSYGELEHLLQRLTPGGARRVFVCGTPPPKEDESFIHSAIAQNSILLRNWQDRKQFDADRAEFTPAVIRLKMWRILQELAVEICQACNAGYIGVPRTAMDDRGFLRPEFYAKDPTHANRTYGKLMLNDILAAQNGSSV